MAHRTLRAISITAATAAIVGVVGIAGAASASGSPRALAHPDSYQTKAGQTLTVKTGRGLLANDIGDLTTITDNTEPAHGSLILNPDGSFSYTPDPGFAGTDTFSYTTTDAVSLFRTSLPPLATIDGVAITGGAYGSSFTPAPGSTDTFYGLTDRGPNVDGPGGTKVEPLVGFTPAIGKFKLTGGKATLQKTIPLTAPDGTPYNGLVNCAASTGETITDLNGTVQPCSDTGYDPEGLVALPDGTFWVSDEYGPLITHFDKNGRQIGRLSPFDHSLPRELANRVPNKGMEGLTVTPNGKMLVGIMQSALQQPDLTQKPANVSPVRIVTIDLKTFAMHEYLYLLDDPEATGSAVSEITAVSNTTFVVDERDGSMEPDAFKKLYLVDVAGATDVGPAANVKGATYDASGGGLLIGSDHKTIEALVGPAGTAQATQRLANKHIIVAAKTLDLDLGGLLTELNPQGKFFGHDKVEGVAVLNGGRTLVVSNDNDFGIDGLANDTPPFQLHAKILPDGTQDDGEYLSIDLRRIHDTPTGSTVTILVKPAKG